MFLSERAVLSNESDDEILFWLQLSAAESYQEMSAFLKEQSEGGAEGEAVEETARSFKISKYIYMEIQIIKQALKAPQ